MTGAYPSDLRDNGVPYRRRHAVKAAPGDYQIEGSVGKREVGGIPNEKVYRKPLSLPLRPFDHQGRNIHGGYPVPHPGQNPGKEPGRAEDLEDSRFRPQRDRCGQPRGRLREYAFRKEIEKAVE